jgi:hypothetical protein
MIYRNVGGLPPGYTPPGVRQQNIDSGIISSPILPFLPVVLRRVLYNLLSS